MRARVVVLVAVISVALGASATAPAAQSVPKVHRVGLLLTTAPSVASHVTAAFSDALRELGHVEGRSINLEYRWAEGRLERLPDLAADLVRLKVDVILASSSPSAEAASRATSAIPIVMVNVADPVGSGLVTSLVRPGGNVTGLASQLTQDIQAKQLQLLKEAVPKAARVAVLRNAAFATVSSWKDYEAAAQAVGVKVQSFDVKGPDELEKVFPVMARERVGALFVPGVNPLFFTHRRRIAELAAEHRLPAMFSVREYADAGGLMSYSARLTDQFRRAAVYVDKVLRGVKPGDLPIEQPTQFELVINLKTAKALGLKLPHSLLLRADQLLE